MITLLLLGCTQEPPKDSSTPVDTGDTSDTNSGDSADSGHDSAVDTDHPDDTSAPDTSSETDTRSDDTAGDTATPYEAPPSEGCAEGVAAWHIDGGTSFTTVQSAMDAVAEGGVIAVCPGSWTEALSVPRDLTLWGYGEGVTILDGGNTRRVLDGNNVTLVLRGLTIRDGLGSGPSAFDRGAGIRMLGGSLQLEDVTFEGGSATSGGGIFLQEGSLDATRVSFLGCSAANDGGAISVETTGTVTLSSVTIDGTSAAYGGGVWSDGGSLTVVDSTLRSISTTDWSGAVSLGGQSELTITGSTFTDNSGTAVYAWGDAVTTIDGSLFEGNVSTGYGGGLLTGSNDGLGSITVTASTFRGNYGAAGGAIYLGGWYGTPLVVDDVTFEDNGAAGNGGAIGIAAYYGAEVTVTDSTFTGNVARDQGGAFYAILQGDDYVTTATLEGCTMSANEAAFGGAVGVEEGDVRLTIAGGSITENVASFEGGGLHIGDGPTVTVTNSDWGEDATDNSPDDAPGGAWGASSSFTCSLGTCY